ncbi:MAG: nucleotidyltransferase domain-containing protein [Cyanobacteria bacterium J06614_10]
MLVSTETIQNFCQEVVKKFQPEQVILFGSYAYGEPNENSDVDILVVLPFEGRAVEKAVEICLAIDYHFPLELLAKTPQTIQKRLDMGDFFIRDIVEKGIVLYEANYARVD